MAGLTKGARPNRAAAIVVDLSINLRHASSCDAAVRTAVGGCKVSELGWEGDAPSAAAGLEASGFTSADLQLLCEAHQSGVAGWRRGQFASNEFSQYLAIWTDGSSEHAQPSLTIIRFNETVAYALIVRGRL